MTRRVIAQGVVTAGLGILLLAAGGAWDEAEADRRRGRPHHGKHHGFHGKHFHGPRVFFGPRFYVGPRAYPYYAYPRYPYYGGYYYGYPPAVVVTPPPPTTYVERAPVTQYWHYCHDPAGYYPDVQQCPGGWTQVPPRSD
jgi:hypothetical protein